MEAKFEGKMHKDIASESIQFNQRLTDLYCTNSPCFTVNAYYFGDTINTILI